MLRHRTAVLKSVGFLVVGTLASLALAQASVGVAEHDEYGPYLVDGEGTSLYLFLPDAEEEDGSACYGDCAAAWPPLTTEEETEASEGVDAELLGAIDREDGAEQVTFDGWPLYSFVQDKEAGDVAGQGVGDNWYLIAPDGTVIGADLEGEGDSEAAGEEGSVNNDLEALMNEGQAVFNANCAECHGRSGDETQAGAVVLDGNNELENTGRILRQVLWGGEYMPSFASQLTNREVRAALTYVRNSWGNDFGPVSGEEVVTERERFD